MPDNNRIDLSGDLDKLSGDLLRDVQAAAECEQRRQEEIKTRGSRKEEKAQSKRLQMTIIAVAAVAMLCVSFWLAFGRSNTIDKVTLDPNQQQRIVINQPTTVQPAPQNNRVLPSQRKQSSEQPPTEYEQPSEDPGM